MREWFLNESKQHGRNCARAADSFYPYIIHRKAMDT